MKQDLALSYWVPCSEYWLERKLAKLKRFDWDEQTLQSIRVVWQQVKAIYERNVKSASIDSDGLYHALNQSIVYHYSSRWIFPAFKNALHPIVGEIKPYPNLPTLYAKNKETHYLWGSCELREIALQLWIYCEQDERRFDQAIDFVWQEYRQYSRYECGSGEADKIAAALRRAADR